MEKVCSIESCEKPLRARGFCSGHYERLRKYGDPLHQPDGRQKPRSDEVKAKIKESLKKSGPWWVAAGVPHPSTGAKVSDETRQKISGSLRGNQNALGHKNALGKTWALSDEQKSSRRGPRPSRYSDTPGYAAVHNWMRRHHEMTGTCEACGSKGRKNYWSNISGEYKRDRSDFWELCVPCHKLFDYILRIEQADQALIAILKARREMEV